MKDLLSVKEFSQFSGIEQTTLRYWDDIGLFPPAVRDPHNNYRYYSPEQIVSVNFISVLSDLNIPLKTIGEVEADRTPEKIAQLIEKKEKQLDMEMRRLRENYSIIHARREFINFGIKVLEGFNVADGKRLSDKDSAPDAERIDVTRLAVMEQEEANYILGPRNIFAKDAEFYEPFLNFCNHADELRINLNFPIGGLHEGIDSFVAAPGNPDYFFSWDPTGNRSRPAGNYLVGFAKGYYGQFSDLPTRLQTYAKDHNLQCIGPVYTMYLHDEICMKDPSQYLSQVSVEVKPA